MPARIRLFALLFFLAFLIIPTRSSAAPERAMRIADRQLIDFGQMVSETSAARFIFVAENHDDKRHHDAQLEFIRRLHRSGRPLAIGLEMFTAGSQEKLDQWVAGKLSLSQFREVYRRNWSVPWEYYRDIFLYARDNRIRLYGLNLPKEISSKVAREGFAALSPRERRRLPAGITCSVSPTYMDLLRKAYSSHGLGDRAFTHFCEAQVLWNRHMANRMQLFMREQPGYSLVALVGIGHALKKGAPAEMGVDASAYRVILPEYRGLNRRNLSVEDADYLLTFGDKDN
jgi:uncharacterized iron-regulated protein